jgi:hypothetical protein
MCCARLLRVGRGRYNMSAFGQKQTTFVAVTDRETCNYIRILQQGYLSQRSC